MSAGSDRRVDLEAVLLAGDEVVGAMSRRRVHGARARVERDVVGQHARSNRARTDGWRKRMCSSCAPFILATGAAEASVRSPRRPAAPAPRP